MNERHRAALDMVYPLADALQMNLILNARKFDNKEELRIVGDQKIRLPVCNGVDFSTLCVVKASNVTPKDSWVLIKVKGDLWVLLTYLRSSKELYLWIIDADKIHYNDRPRTGSSFLGKGIDFLTEKLSPGCLRIYKRKKEDPEWSLLDDALGVDGPLSPGEAAAAKAAEEAEVVPADEESEDKDSPKYPGWVQ